MKRPVMLHKEMIFIVILAVFIAALFLLAAAPSSWARKNVPPSAPRGYITEGSLISIDSDGRLRDFCPLKHTDVKVEVTGFLTRVNVTQQFENPAKDTIEAVYTFPLPQGAAVDNMSMLVGERVVRAEIKRREDAQAIYAAARSGGKVAGLLDQERANIFTQSVANILPGEQVKITISYVELLDYEDGSYELIFPMVVGPRYIPGSRIGKQGGGWAPDTDRVPDASRITPPVTPFRTPPPQASLHPPAPNLPEQVPFPRDAPLPEGTRAGHDVSIEVSLDAGLPIEGVRSATHEIDVERTAANRARVQLRQKGVIPNKDFLLRYDVTGRKIQDGLLTHRNGRDGFFTLILQPPDHVTAAEVAPKELIFVLDTSGSMSGFPIEKAKETMRLALDGLYAQDTFNLITFSGDTHILFPEPVPATKENLRQAQAFLQSRSGRGGTEMMNAIRAALDPSDSQGHVRIVCFMTDGYVGNDMEIIAEVQKHPNARVFSFGIGSSVNRFLLDKMAQYGRGEVEYVGLQDDGSAAARRFHERVRNPLLTDISVDWNRLPITDVYPKRIPDLFSAKPVVVYGRYTRNATGVIRLRGKSAGREMVREIRVDLPTSETHHDVLATLWARTRIDDLMAQDYNGIQRGTTRPELKTAITQLGLDYRLMTQFTSFVAVEEMVVTDGGQPRRIDVPVEIPEGVSYEGVFGGGAGDFKSNAPVGMTSSAALERSMARRGFVDISKEPAAQAPPHMTLLKQHPSIASLIDRLKKQAAPGLDEAKFVKNGRAEIQVWLFDTTPATLDEIKKLGFEIVLQPKTGKLVIGRVPIEKLAALAALKSVRYLAPQLTTI